MREERGRWENRGEGEGETEGGEGEKKGQREDPPRMRFEDFRVTPMGLTDRCGLTCPQSRQNREDVRPKHTVVDTFRRSRTQTYRGIDGPSVLRPRQNGQFSRRNKQMPVHSAQEKVLCLSR